MNPYQ